MTWLAIATGGALGSIARHVVNQLVHAAAPTRFPLGIVVVNIAGCFVIGLLAGAMSERRLALSADWERFVFVGVLGGFTTFSTFGLDTFVLAREQQIGAALLNVFAHVAGGLLAVWLGYSASRLL